MNGVDSFQCLGMLALAAAALVNERRRRQSNSDFAVLAEPEPDVTDASVVDEKLERPMRFVIDALLVAESFQHVCPAVAGQRESINGFREEFHYATGVRIDARTFVVTRIVPVRYARQSAGGVRVADESNVEALANLDRLGLPLVMHFHSHPGFGRGANRPSMIDRAFQERLERGGHIAIGGIFSRDGFLRFFAGDLDRFVVEVCGKQVNKVADNEFQLQLGDGVA